MIEIRAKMPEIWASEGPLSGVSPAHALRSYLVRFYPSTVIIYIYIYIYIAGIYILLQLIFTFLDQYFQL